MLTIKFIHEVEDGEKIIFLKVTVPIENDIILPHLHIKPISSNTTKSTFTLINLRIKKFI